MTYELQGTRYEFNILKYKLLPGRYDFQTSNYVLLGSKYIFQLGKIFGSGNIQEMNYLKKFELK
jgi:hypothetical protein